MDIIEKRDVVPFIDPRTYRTVERCFFEAAYMLWRQADPWPEPTLDRETADRLMARRRMHQRGMLTEFLR